MGCSKLAREEVNPAVVAACHAYIRAFTRTIISLTMDGYSKRALSLEDGRTARYSVSPLKLVALHVGRRDLASCTALCDGSWTYILAAFWF